MNPLPASICYVFGELFEFSAFNLFFHMACLPATIVEAGDKLLYPQCLDSPLYFFLAMLTH